MSKARVNFIVDLAAFVDFVALTSTGLILKFMLPPGSGRIEAGGTGSRGGGRSVDLLWGLSRHEWGDIHIWLSVALLAILALHVFLHWRWIVGIARGRRSEASGARLGLGAVSLVAVIVLAAMPFFSGKTSVPRDRGSAAPASVGAEPAASEHEDGIRGSMTLGELASSTSVPLEYLKAKLNLPADTNPEERLGRLRRTAGFEMEEVRKAVEEYKPRH